MRSLLSCITILLLCISGFSHATVITDPNVLISDGATLVDFTEVPLDTPNPTIGAVSFTGVFGPVATSMEACGGFCYPAVPPTLINQTLDGFGTAFDIFFTEGATSMGLGIGAINTATTITAFDLDNNILGMTPFDGKRPGITP